MSLLSPTIEKLKSNPFVAFVLAVQQRYSQDKGGYLATVISYYAFLSLIPMILLASSIIGFVLARNPTAAANWTAKLTSFVPGVGNIIGRNVGAVIKARARTGVFGLVSLLAAGLAAIDASEYALGRVFRVERQGSFIKLKLASLGELAGVGSIAVASIAVPAFIGSLAKAGSLHVILKLGEAAVALALDLVMFLVTYRLLIPGRGPKFKELWPGALFASAGWTALQTIGAWYVNRTLRGATQVYGTFAAVVALLTLLFLVARLFVYGAELNAYLADTKLAKVAADLRNKGERRRKKAAKQLPLA